VRERLFEDQNGGASSKEKKVKMDVQDLEAPTTKDRDCIADSYENATVMFGDLAGFTAWSNGREPKDVFNLLETLVSFLVACDMSNPRVIVLSKQLILTFLILQYGAFDKIAKRRCVFKIETVSGQL
jgi:hypothetical protein